MSVILSVVWCVEISRPIGCTFIGISLSSNELCRSALNVLRQDGQISKDSWKICSLEQ